MRKLALVVCVAAVAYSGPASAFYRGVYDAVPRWFDPFFALGFALSLNSRPAPPALSTTCADTNRSAHCRNSRVELW